MSSGMRINFATNTVTITNAYNRRANNPGSYEFNVLKELREMGMNIVIKPQCGRRKVNPYAIGYDKMRCYIGMLNNADIMQKEFDSIVEISKSQTHPYSYVRDWFKNKFPNFSLVPNFDENYHIIPFDAA